MQAGSMSPHPLNLVFSHKSAPLCSVPAKRLQKDCFRETLGVGSPCLSKNTYSSTCYGNFYRDLGNFKEALILKLTSNSDISASTMMTQQVEALFLILLCDLPDIEMILQEAGTPVLMDRYFFLVW